MKNIVNGIDNMGLEFNTGDIERVVQNLIEKQINEDESDGVDLEEFSHNLFLYARILRELQDTIIEHIESRVAAEK